MPVFRSRVLLLSVFLAYLSSAGCATLPRDFERTWSQAYPPAADSIVDEGFKRKLDAHPGESGYYLLDNGLDAFVARAVLASRATRGIDAQYYLYHNDLTGGLFTDLLLKAANRGVRVRLLVDDMGAEGRDRMAAVFDSHPNVEVRVFNPFSRSAPRVTQYVTGFGKVTRRMHNKTFTVDNQISILGGRNIGDEYFDAGHDLVFSDLDALVVGPLVPDISRSFDLYWNHELSYPISVLNTKKVSPELMRSARDQLASFVEEQRDSEYLKALRDSEFAREIRNSSVELYWGQARVVYDHPEKLLTKQDNEAYHLAPALREYFRNVRKELIIISPYFVPGKRGAALFEDLADRGVRVRVLTNSLAATDVAVVHAGYARYRRRLLRAGVEIYEADKKARAAPHSKEGLKGYSKASLHTKSFIFDRKHVFIGSLNLDPRSLRENTEIGLMLDSTGVANDMLEWFDRFTREQSFEVSLGRNDRGFEQLNWVRSYGSDAKRWITEPHSSLWQRISVGLLRLLPVESQL